MSTKITSTIILTSEEEAQLAVFNASFDLTVSLLTADKSDVDENAVAQRAWFFFRNLIKHNDINRSYGNDYEANLLLATDSALMVAEEELGAYHVQQLLSLL